LKIAIIGATGFIGSNLTRTLSRRGYDVIAVTRNVDTPLAGLKGVTCIRGDIHDIDSLKNALGEIDTVYHLVGIIAETRELTFEKTVIEGTRNLVAACRQCGVKKIIYLSALGTARKIDSRYFRSKQLAEKAIKDSGMTFTILRPSVVYGPEDKFINMLAGLIKRLPFMPVIGHGHYPLQPLYVNDLAAILESSLNKTETTDRIIEVGGPEIFELRELLSVIKKALDKKRISIYIPFWFMKFNAGLMEMVLRPTPITREQLDMLKAGSTCDNSEFDFLFNIRLTKLEDGLREYLR
jgi:uncharacterized protein YbjT (DUF2867 family)